MTEQPFPNFFLVGAVKAGTTTVYKTLQTHPDIFLSPIKEPNYFCTDVDPEHFSQGYRRTLVPDVEAYIRAGMRSPQHIAHVREERQYRALFSGARGHVAIGECSNSYLFSKAAAVEIRRRVPAAKVVMVLRDPVDRAYSQYLMDKRLGLVRGSFLDVVRDDLSKDVRGWGITRDYVSLGLYHAQVKRYLDVFSEQQVAVFLFDELAAAPADLFDRLARFLGVSPVWDRPTRQENAAAIPRFPRMNYHLSQLGVRYALGRVLPGRVKRRLKHHTFHRRLSSRCTPAERRDMLPYFRDDIEKLEALIGTDLSEWKDG